MSAFCPRCGSATGPKDRFCKRCGGNLQNLRSKLGTGISAIASGTRPAARPTVPASAVAAPARPAAVAARAAAPAPPAPPAAPARSPAPAGPGPARQAPSRIVLPDVAEPAAEDEDLFAGMIPRGGSPSPTGRPPTPPVAGFEVPDDDEPPDLPPMRPGAQPPAPKIAAPPPKPAPPPPPPPPPEPDPIASSGSALNFLDLESSFGGGSAADVDFSSLSSPALAADEGASFYDLDALSSSGAPVPPSEGGEAVYDLDSFFSGSGPVAAAKAAPKAPAKPAPQQELVDFSALSSSEPSAYDLDSLSLLGGTDPFASLLVPSAGQKGGPAIPRSDVMDMENELARASQGSGTRKPAAGSPCLVVYQNNKAVNYYALGQEETFLGRDEEGENTFPGLDLSRYDPTGAISALHASILCEGSKYFIQDIPQSSGTKVNGNMLPKGQKVPLKDGDALLLGNAVLLRFEVMK